MERKSFLGSVLGAVASVPLLGAIVKPAPSSVATGFNQYLGSPVVVWDASYPHVTPELMPYARAAVEAFAGQIKHTGWSIVVRGPLDRWARLMSVSIRRSAKDGRWYAMAWDVDLMNDHDKIMELARYTGSTAAGHANLIHALKEIA
ncbi:MAG: hypothetical protein KGL39_22075 [Patescibacteria group bacterium]|nr:hypothetical protein [Patescibacteria group bacterium]